MSVRKTDAPRVHQRTDAPPTAPPPKTTKTKTTTVKKHEQNHGGYEKVGSLVNHQDFEAASGKA